MIESEIRFKLDSDPRQRLANLGFRHKSFSRMSDLVFEPKEWIPGTGIRKGYFIVRIRLETERVPRLEIKEFEEDNKWKETSMEISDPGAMLGILSAIMVPRKVISKTREVWAKKDIEVSIDNVEDLGKFIEIEGPENSIKELATSLEFDLKDQQPVYGSLLFRLEKEGKIKFSFDQMQKVLELFR